MLRFDGKWKDYLIVDRPTLLSKYEKKNMGSESDTQLTLYVQYRSQKIECSDCDLTKFRNNWDRFFPSIAH